LFVYVGFTKHQNGRFSREVDLLRMFGGRTLAFRFFITQNDIRNEIKLGVLKKKMSNYLYLRKMLSGVSFQYGPGFNKKKAQLNTEW
jgi:hypothetical protein